MPSAFICIEKYFYKKNQENIGYQYSYKGFWVPPTMYLAIWVFCPYIQRSSFMHTQNTKVNAAKNAETSTHIAVNMTLGLVGFLN